MNDTLKLCRTCNTEKNISLFVKCKTTKSGVRGLCKACSCAYYAQRRIDKYDIVRAYEKKFHRKRRLRYDYNTTEEHIQSLLETQDYRCKLCQSDKKLVIDHCHSSGKVRGMLCLHCNTGLGQFKDNIKTLEKAIDYLNAN